MEEILFIITSAFTRGGFTVEDEESGIDLLKKADVRYAFPKIRKAELSRCVSGRGQYLGTEASVTAEVKCFGTDCGYKDGSFLRELAGRVGRILLLEHEKNVRWISTGELIRDPVSGRMVLTVTLELKGYEEAEVTGE